MRIPFISMFMTSPFDGLMEHAEKLKECVWAFQQAMECYIEDRCKTFEEFRKEIVNLESQADAIKRRIRGHLPKGTLMPVDKFQLFRYIREQDHVLDSVQDALNWISYRKEARIPQSLTRDFIALVDAVIDPIDEMNGMVVEARKYFSNFSEKQRVLVKDIIRTLRHQEHEADQLEDEIKHKIFNSDMDPLTAFHLIRLAEIIGSIADHAENAGDMMRAMLAK